ncbi:MAG: 1-deoxy-D-xylulose-5-phosphate reductoisomerase [Clostridia bacterium]|nr:1-deoxy-D-xylulose-5-phosphate reductoisomerase [Clostridia bacterium]
MLNLHPKKDFIPRSAVVLGSTGSVGTQTLDVITELGLNVRMLTAGTNTELLAAQIRRYHPEIVAVVSEQAANDLRDRIDGNLPVIVWDQETALQLIEQTDADIIFHSVAGLAGIPYALAAARSGKRIGMANKEAIIAAGELIFSLMRKSGGEMIPVDSEHSAVFRCMEGKSPEDVAKIHLTASGGPFFGKMPDELKSVTAAEALAHPTWKMGKKITVDSATLMNKGFEIIEAVKLFGVPEDRVDVLIHRQSIIHSLVEYTDHTFLAQMGRPDMRDCIRYAATAPHTKASPDAGIDLVKIGSLTFDRPDINAFPLLETAREAVREGGTATTALIAADEAAVEAFLDSRIGFTEISSVVHETLAKVRVYSNVTEETVAETDREARQITRSLIENCI